MPTRQPLAATRSGEGARRLSPDTVVPPPVGGRRHAQPAFWLRYRQALGTLAGRQKPGIGVPAYMRWVNRRLARPMAALAFTLRMTPNQATALSALASAAGLAILIAAPRDLMTGIAVSVLLALGFALDSADGQLARLRGEGGPAGEWVDHVVDAVRSPAIHVVTAVALWQHQGPGAMLVLPLIFALIVTTTFIAQILAEQLAAGRNAIASVNPDPGPARSWLLLPVDTGMICWVFLTWPNPALFAGCYLALAVAHLLYLGVTLRRKYALLTSIGVPA
ncbi:MAG: CDP-alcohol phosphatidyltransferase family protein [Beutenbergiaceae bacterium]